MAAVEAWLNGQSAAHPELAEHYSIMLDFYERRLWHQLTMKLEAGTLFIDSAQLSAVCRRSSPSVPEPETPLRLWEFSHFIAQRWCAS